MKINNKELNTKNILLIIALIVIISLMVYINKIKTEQNNNILNSLSSDSNTSVSTTSTSTTNSKVVLKNVDIQSNLVEKATGFIKRAYTKNDKNYIDIDYIIIESCMESRPNNCPNGVFVKNDNPLIRTFELSPNVIIKLQNNQIINYPGFVRITQDKNDYRSLNPWNIVIKNGLIIEIEERFLP